MEGWGVQVEEVVGYRGRVEGWGCPGGGVGGVEERRWRCGSEGVGRRVSAPSDYTKLFSLLSQINRINKSRAGRPDPWPWRCPFITADLGKGHNLSGSWLPPL